MPLMFMLTAVVVIWSIGLEGAKEGLAVYLKPDFGRLSDIRVWMDAFSQIFFSLSLGFGVMVVYASYLPRKSQIVRDACTISFLNCFFSIFAGFGVFSILGYMAHTTGKPFLDVVSQSIGLAFVAYPKAISMLPCCAHLFGILFFGVLVIAGLSSGISILEGFTSAVIDKFHYPRKIVVSVTALSGFLGGMIFATRAGLHWLDIVDHFITHYGIIITTILECVAVGWAFKAAKLREHINHFSRWKLWGWWDFLIKVFICLVLGGLLFSSLGEEVLKPYGGYSWLAIILIGRDWLIYTLFFALIVAAHPWKIEPEERIRQISS